jgi:galactose oxidase
MNQRFNELSFTRVTGGLRVTAPGTRNLAPPGHYLMFVLNGNGVPSVAKVIRIS